MKKTKFYYSFIISYILILMIPCVAFLGLFAAFNASYIDEMLGRRLDNLEYLHDSIEEQVSILDTIAVSVMEDVDFSRYRIINSPGTAFFEIGSKLGDYNLTNDFMDDVYYYSKDSDYIYGATHILKDSFFRKIEVTSIESGNNFEALLTQEYSSRWITIETDLMKNKPESSIAYIVSTDSIHVGGVQSALIYLFKADHFANMISASMDEGTFVNLELGGVMVHEGLNESKVEVIKSSNTEQFSQIIRYNEEEYYKLKVTNSEEESPLEITLFYPVKELSMYNTPIFITALVTFIIIIALGVGMITLFVKYNYSPIRQLSMYARSLGGEEPEGLNEFAKTQFVLEKLHSVNQNMKSLNEQYEKERIILKAINNTIIDKERLLDECEKANIRTDYTHFCCVCVQIPYYKRAIYNILISELELEEVSFAFYNNLILIIGTNVKDNAYVTQVTDLLKGSLLDEGDELHMGVGSFVDDIADLNTTYYQALISLNRAQKTNCEMERFSRLNNANLDKTEGEKKHLANFYEAIVGRNIKKIERNTQFFKKHLLANEAHLYTCIYVAHAVMNTCIQALKALEVDTENISDKYTFKLNNNDITHVEVIVRILEDMKIEVIEKLNEMDSKEKNNKQQLDIDEIKTYIKLNHDSQDLSVQRVADEFDTSLSNISHFFKNKMDENISTYIMKIRIERAKVLLVDSDIPVGKIVSELGLAYASNFIRNFKSYTGMTPGQYREHYREK